MKKNTSISISNVSCEIPSNNNRSCHYSSYWQTRNILAVSFVIFFCCIARVQSSAIPMWEFLTREEKMSHLYRIFSQEVSQFCSDSTMPDCSKNLLVTGLKSLANMKEDQLDQIDPYQRGAKELIWRSMIGNDRFSSVSRLDQHSYHSTDADPLAFGDNELAPAAEETSSNNDYLRPDDHSSGPYLMGPMVIRVYPDGRPVASDLKRPLPKDEDIEDIRYSRLPLTASASTTSAKIAPVGKDFKSDELKSSNIAPNSSNPDKVFFYKRFSNGEFQPVVRKSLRIPILYRRSSAFYFSPMLRPNNLFLRERYY